MYNISEVCFEKCSRIGARREVVSLSEVLRLRAMLCSCTWSVANWMVQVTRISYRWFVGVFSPYARLWGQLLAPGRECSQLQIKVVIVNEWLHASVHCAKSPDLKSTDNFWADIKPDLSRNTRRNVLEFEITIHDILNQIPTKSFLQLAQSMISRIQNCLNTRGRSPAIMLLFVVL